MRPSRASGVPLGRFTAQAGHHNAPDAKRLLAFPINEERKKPRYSWITVDRNQIICMKNRIRFLTVAITNGS